MANSLAMTLLLLAAPLLDAARFETAPPPGTPLVATEAPTPTLAPGWTFMECLTLSVMPIAICTAVVVCFFSCYACLRKRGVDVDLESCRKSRKKRLNEEAAYQLERERRVNFEQPPEIELPDLDRFEEKEKEKPKPPPPRFWVGCVSYDLELNRAQQKRKMANTQSLTDSTVPTEVPKTEITQMHTGSGKGPDGLKPSVRAARVQSESKQVTTPPSSDSLKDPITVTKKRAKVIAVPIDIIEKVGKELEDAKRTQDGTTEEKTTKEQDARTQVMDPQTKRGEPESGETDAQTQMADVKSKLGTTSTIQQTQVLGVKSKYDTASTVQQTQLLGVKSKYDAASTIQQTQLLGVKSNYDTPSTIQQTQLLGVKSQHDAPESGETAAKDEQTQAIEPKPDDGTTPRTESGEANLAPPPA
ncbi:unnamed protein product, partial [Mesorhabditis spiculigera]